MTALIIVKRITLLTEIMAYMFAEAEGFSYNGNKLLFLVTITHHTREVVNTLSIGAIGRLAKSKCVMLSCS